VRPALIALDWGTTALRAHLLGTGGAVLEARAEPWGIARLPEGGFAAAYDGIVHGWPRLPAIASGMVGSALGWVEVPYRPCPAGEEDLAASLGTVPGRDLHVVPGLLDAGRPDVMRGEETQVVGALALRPELADGALLLMPGTHSKWVRVAAGRVRGFATYLTGELFAALRGHTILGRPARDAGAAPEEEGREAFARGVLAAAESPDRLAPLLFTARSLVLTGRLGAAASVEYLSGLVIGDEIRAGLAGGTVPAALIGDPSLCRRYTVALGLLGAPEPAVLADAAPAGLWRIAVAAGLIDSAAAGDAA
jgi:2-dehydro-3-deoxygalactonokinase